MDSEWARGSGNRLRCSMRHIRCLRTYVVSSLDLCFFYSSRLFLTFRQDAVISRSMFKFIFCYLASVCLSSYQPYLFKIRSIFFFSPVNAPPKTGGRLKIAVEGCILPRASFSSKIVVDLYASNYVIYLSRPARVWQYGKYSHIRWRELASCFGRSHAPPNRRCFCISADNEADSIQMPSGYLLKPRTGSRLLLKGHYVARRWEWLRVIFPPSAAWILESKDSSDAKQLNFDFREDFHSFFPSFRSPILTFVLSRRQTHTKNGAVVLYGIVARPLRANFCVYSSAKKFLFFFNSVLDQYNS